MTYTAHVLLEDDNKIVLTGLEDNEVYYDDFSRILSVGPNFKVSRDKFVNILFYSDENTSSSTDD